MQAFSCKPGMHWDANCEQKIRASMQRPAWPALAHAVAVLPVRQGLPWRYVVVSPLRRALSTAELHLLATPLTKAIKLKCTAA